MLVVVNGMKREVTTDCTAAELLDELALTEHRVAVERNGEVIARQALTATRLCAGDIVEIVRFVGGG
ncbi:MAG: sulfur carrier protein ThiS [Bacilli bacterium]